MLPRMCSHPRCMNIALMGVSAELGCTRQIVFSATMPRSQPTASNVQAGTLPHSRMKRSSSSGTLPVQVQLVEEHDEVEGDDREVDVGDRAGARGIEDWDHSPGASPNASMGSAPNAFSSSARPALRW